MIDVGGSRQGHLHEEGGLDPFGSQGPVLLIGFPVAQDPVIGELVVIAGGDLGKGETRGVSRHVVVAQDPGRRRFRPFGHGDPFPDGSFELVAGPVHLGELEVEDLPQLVFGGIKILSVGIDPSLRHGEAAGAVLIEDLAPLAVNLMYFVAVIKRVGPSEGRLDGITL